jgi:hypothetical protein
MKTYEELSEDFALKEADNRAEFYHTKYKSHIESFEKNAVWKKCRPITSFDVVNLGKMLESYDMVQMMCEADNSVADLGVLPRIAHDVITVSYGTSPLALVASVQPLAAERGFVLFKRVLAGTTKGNKTAADIMADAREGIQEMPNAYASGGIITESWGTGDGSTTNFTGTASNTPLRARTIKVTTTVGSATITGEDNGAGAIVGAGFADSCTINVATGAFDLTFTTAPDNAATITTDYQINLELSTSTIPVVQTDLQDIDVRANPYVLKAEIGMFKAFKMAKEYGLQSAEDDMAQDLVNMLNVEIFGDLVRRANTAKQGNTTFALATPSNISDADHRQGFKLKLAAAESTLVANAGRGTRSYYIGGVTFCEYCSTMPGWVGMYDGATIAGAHLYGTLDGIPVIRIPADTNVITAAKAVIGYKGSQFDAALYYAPYMPLTTTGMLPTTNPLVRQRAVASWSAVGVGVGQFLTGFSIE